MAERKSLLTIVLILAASWLATTAAARGPAVRSAAGPADRPGERSLEAFVQRHPGTRVFRKAGRISRIYGVPLSRAASARQSAERFCHENAWLFGLEPGELAAGDPGGRETQPVMYDPETGAFKFHAFYHRQQRGGIPVFDSRLVLLVRNEPGYPLVLASSTLRDLGDFMPDVLPHGAAGELVIWPGHAEPATPPRVARKSIVVDDLGERLILTDVRSGELLLERELICYGDLSGSVAGRATAGEGAEDCEDELSTPLPHLEVTAGDTTVIADEHGQFTIPDTGSPQTLVTTQLRGLWIDVFDDGGDDVTLSADATPPDPLDLLFNADNVDERVRAQVNAYVHANRVRDFVHRYNPLFPGIGTEGFPVNVNITDFACPGQAWYSPAGPSINFCLSGVDADGLMRPNTAWSSVIYHEFGHHIVNMAGSGQGEYGEGLGDCLSVLLLDTPRIAPGFYGDCAGELRNADNELTFPCYGGIHFCGQLLSGSVWSIRNHLAATHPNDYTDILGRIVVNSTLLHTGSEIDPGIGIDFLLLDDDDTQIVNGTPHADAILRGLQEHDMANIVGFTFPDGLPRVVATDGSSTVRFRVLPGTVAPRPGSAMLHVAVGAGLAVPYPATQIGADLYEASFPAASCGVEMRYHLTAEGIAGGADRSPDLVPDDFHAAVAAESVGRVLLDDDFETDQGWQVYNFGVTAGHWERGVPRGGERGDPRYDADGSGACYVTGRRPGDSDVDGPGWTILVSPRIDGSDPDTYVSYYRWISTVEGVATFSDTLNVQISSNDGIEWVDLETVGPEGPVVEGGWHFRQLRVADYVTPSERVRIRFLTADAGPPSIVEAAVDGVKFFVIECE